jgi:hypothetical protein
VDLMSCFSRKALPIWASQMSVILSLSTEVVNTGPSCAVTRLSQFSQSNKNEKVSPTTGSEEACGGSLGRSVCSPASELALTVDECRELAGRRWNQMGDRTYLCARSCDGCIARTIRIALSRSWTRVLITRASGSEGESSNEPCKVSARTLKDVNVWPDQLRCCEWICPGHATCCNRSSCREQLHAHAADDTSSKSLIS